MRPSRGPLLVLGRGPLAQRLSAALGAENAPCLAASTTAYSDRARSPSEIWNLCGLLPTIADVHDAARALGETREIAAFAHDVGARLHHVSTMALGGDFEGIFTEKHFDEGQSLPNVLAQAAFDQELAVTTVAPTARIYRLAHLLGDTVTGEHELDGPAHFFEALFLTSLLVPQRWPLYGPDFGQTDVIPIDFAVAAMATLGDLAGAEGRVFHIGSGAALRTADVHNAFADVARAPHARVLERPSGPGSIALATYRAFMTEARWARLRSFAFRAISVPEVALSRLAFEFTFDSTDTSRLLLGRGVVCPPLPQYAAAVWNYWLRELRINP